MGIFSKRPDSENTPPDTLEENIGFEIGSSNTHKTVPNHALTADEITAPKVDFKPTAESSPLEALKRKMMQNTANDTENKEEKPKEKSLLEKCMPYIIDEEGNNAADEEPSYTLDSVSDILKSENTKTIEKIARKYEITFDDLGKYSSIIGSVPAEPKAEEKEEKKEELSEEECQTCERRKYQDGSDDPSVSFKTAGHIDPSVSASVVRGHEMEHVVNNRAKAQREDREIISQSVTLHSAICPECGTVYTSGGTTRTVMSGKKQEPEQLPGQEQRVPFFAVA